MTAALIAALVVGYLALAVLLGRLLGRRRKRDDWMDLADACRGSDTPIGDALAAELQFDPIDPAAVERIKERVEDELAQRRGRVQ